MIVLKNPGSPKPDELPHPRDPLPVFGPVASPDTDWADLRPDVICHPSLTTPDRG